MTDSQAKRPTIQDLQKEMTEKMRILQLNEEKLDLQTLSLKIQEVGKEYGDKMKVEGELMRQ